MAGPRLMAYDGAEIVGMARARTKNGRKYRRLLSWGIVLILVVAIVGWRLVGKIGRELGPADRFTVLRVIDGDTVELTGGDRVRLLGLDTPERGERFYTTAKELLARLVEGKRVRIEYGNARRDRYGRMLGYLFSDDTLLANRVLIDSGLGYLYLFSDNDLASSEIKTMLAAQRNAIDRKVGLWSVSREPEEHYVATEHSFRLHRPNCASVRNLKPGHYRTFKTREEGLAEGLSPCRECKP
jgi:micrococcal nuclease